MDQCEPKSEAADLYEKPSAAEDDKEDRAEWTVEQEKHLRELVSSFGAHNWSQISQRMNAAFPGAQKASKQCRERWHNKLDPDANRSPWSKQEEARLIMAHMSCMNRWADIAASLKGRNNNMVKNRFYSILRKVKNKVRHSDFSHCSKLELYEMYYMVSVMEQYASHPQQPEELTRKRGKDVLNAPF